MRPGSTGDSAGLKMRGMDGSPMSSRPRCRRLALAAAGPRGAWPGMRSGPARLPLGPSRWTPLEIGGRVAPGDVVRTSPRGANAVELELGAGGTVTLGPGAEIELRADGTVHLLQGDVAFAP